MSSMRDPLAGWALAMMRIVAGGLFILHGVDKVWGLPGVGGDTVSILSLTGVAGMIEFGAGSLVVLGLFTRPAALIASGLMACAYWIAHAPSHLLPALNGGDAAVLFCFVFLYLAAVGPGDISLDARLQRAGEAPVIRRRRHLFD